MAAPLILKRGVSGQKTEMIAFDPIPGVVLHVEVNCLGTGLPYFIQPFVRAFIVLPQSNAWNCPQC
jgi:hypothetical protein